MATEKKYDYPRAPLTVELANGRTLDFEVSHDGEVEITAEVDDYGAWSGPRTTEATFWVSAEDWAAIVAHIAADLPSPAEA